MMPHQSKEKTTIRVKRKSSLLLLFLLVSCNIWAQGPSLCNTAPFAVTVTQPDGSELEVIGVGNMFLNYTETTDGFTILKNVEGNYCYAEMGNGGNLVPTKIPASEEDLNRRTFPMMENFKATTPKHLRNSPEVEALVVNGKRMATLLNQQGNNTVNTGDKPLNQTFPTSGKRRALMILIQYKDQKSKYTPTDFKNMMNQVNYNSTGSFRDYYLQNSFNKLDVTVDVFGWYTSDSSYKYYGNNTTGADAGQARAKILVAQAIDSAHAAGVDFSLYDNDKDGNVDGVMVVHSGPGAEEGAQNQYIWSHRWTLDNYKRKYNGVTMDNYIVMPETRGGNTRMVGRGVFCHEFGHLLGLPDLYDVLNKSEGVGNWALMAGGEWLGTEAYPASHDAWSKVLLKWIRPVQISGDGFYTLKPSTVDSTIYKVTTPVSHEYYLLENRQKKGVDLYLDGHGLAIWHVDDSVIQNGLFANLVNTVPKHKGLDLVQADGKHDLDTMKSPENRGDAGDLYPGSSNNTNFTDSTIPSARSYNKRYSNIRIFKIAELKDSSITFGFGALPQAFIKTPVSNICQNGIISFGNNSKYADKYVWFHHNRIDSSIILTDTFKSAGKFLVKLGAISKTGIITYDSVYITVNANAVANFSISLKKLVVTFINHSLNASSYNWSFGDGSVGFFATPTFQHTYKDTGTFSVRLVVVGLGGCNDTITKSIHIDGVSGIAEARNAIEGLAVYPNPLHNNVSIQFDIIKPSSLSIVLYNAIGQEEGILDETKLFSGKYNRTFDLSSLNLPKGLHFIKISTDQLSQNISIVKY